MMNNNFIITTGTLNIQGFAEVIKADLEARHPEATVRVHEVKKNNDCVLTAVTVCDKGINTAPTLYMEGFYDDYKTGRPIESIFDAVNRLYKMHKAKLDFDFNSISTLDCVQDKLCYKLINRAKNKELLKKIPYIPVLDLAVVFYIRVEADDIGMGTIQVSDMFMDIWGNPDVQELFKIAKRNTMRFFKGRISNMMEIMGEIISQDDNVDSDIRDCFYEMDAIYEDNFCPMYICTNIEKMYGAGVILYSGLLKAFSERIGGDFYILPSSVHETIFVPANEDLDANYLSEMVRQVNATEVQPEEYLSDSVYRYDSLTDHVEIM